MSEPMNLHLVMRAVSFATRVHQGQFRKSNGDDPDERVPYVSHPVRVMAIVAMEFGVREPDVLAAAVLHDTIEDTLADRDDLAAKFNERVAEWVALLSKDKRLPEAERESRYFETLAAAPVEVMLCKLADVIDNLLDSEQLGVALRRKKIAAARELVDLLAPDFPDEWRHALDRTRRQIEEAEHWGAA